MRKVTWIFGTITIAALLATIGFVAFAQGPEPAPAAANAPLWSSGPVRSASAVHVVAAARAAVPATGYQSSPPPADEILAGAIEAMSGLDAWHFEAWLDLVASFRSIAFEAPLTYVGDYAAPDRMTGTASVQVLGFTLERDIVFVCNTVDGSDPATDPVKCSMFSLLEFGGFEISDIQDLEFVAEEDIGGTSAYHLQGKLVTHNAQAPSEGTAYAFEGKLLFDLWIGVADGLPQAMSLEGKLAMVGPAEGTLQVSGGAAWSEFGQPLTAEEAARTATVETACAAAGEGFVAYSDTSQATTFCYPDGWVVDDLVDSCGFYAVSPTGVGYGRQVPKSLVVIHPPATVSGFGHWTVGAVEVVARPSVCFYGWIRDTLQPGNTGNLVMNYETLLGIGAWLMADSPMVMGMTGTEYPGAKAVSLGGAVDGEANGPAVEAIIDSVVVGKTATP